MLIFAISVSPTTCLDTTKAYQFHINVKGYPTKIIYIILRNIFSNFQSLYLQDNISHNRNINNVI